jgi:ATP-dependent Clp protease ATP-binding subunit ClpX
MTDTVKTDDAHCSFCGVEQSASVPLIAGNEGRICEDCVTLAHQVVSSWGGRNKGQSVAESLRTPQQIKDFLDDYIIGQDNAKATLAVAAYNHYMRLLNQESHTTLCTDDYTELEKSNVLMAGPSGTGKTLLVKTLAKIIGVPFVVADATTLTQAGYVGDDADTILQRLVESAGGDVQLAQWGIVYIDEIDKIARSGNSATAVRDVSGEGVQQALLKMVEGSEVRLSKPNGRQQGRDDDEKSIDTTHILFIVGGAFAGLEDLIGKRIKPETRSIGFQASYDDEAESEIDELLAAMRPDDLQAFGLIPEFIGRFPIITFLQALDVDALLRVLQEPRNALVKQYTKLFSYQNVELVFTDAALKHIAQEAVDRNTGARGLRGVLESVLRNTMFDMPSREGLKKCIVKARTVDEHIEVFVEEVFTEASGQLESHADDTPIAATGESA